jgi:hypothetical protein
MKIIHYYNVAKHFSIFSKEFYLALFHDSVEDGYLPKIICKYWKSLDAITRITDEQYFKYIERVKLNTVAKNVKIADVTENLKRCPDSLKKRYLKALNKLKYD